MKCKYLCCCKCPWRMRWTLHDGTQTKQMSPTISLTVTQNGDYKKSADELADELATRLKQVFDSAWIPTNRRDNREEVKHMEGHSDTKPNRVQRTKDAALDMLRVAVRHNLDASEINTAIDRLKELMSDAPRAIRLLFDEETRHNA